MTTITRLEAENFLKLKAIEITPEGNVVQIRGANGAGKSSVLNAIAAAIGGERLCPQTPIRKGETSARVSLDLGELTVTRTWTEKGSKLEVAHKDGSKLRKPQEVLTSMLGEIAFDPLSFMRMKPKEQADYLRELTGLDFSDLEKERARAYEQRTTVGREGASLKARLEAMPPPAVDVPDEVSASTLLEEQADAISRREKNSAIRAELGEANRNFAMAEREAGDALRTIQSLEQQLDDWRAKAQRIAAGLGQSGDLVDELKKKVASIVEPDLAPIAERLRGLEAQNARSREMRATEEFRAKLGKSMEQKRAAFSELAKKIAEIDAEKECRLSEAKLPVPGLGFDADGVTLDGLPVSQASSAQQLKLSMAIGLAVNPGLRVVLIRDGSLLDQESLATVAEMAEKASAQVWLEVVSTEGGPGSVLIEDGSISEPTDG